MKIKQNISLTIRVSADLANRIRRDAIRNKRSVNQWIALLLEAIYKGADEKKEDLK